MRIRSSRQVGFLDDADRLPPLRRLSQNFLVDPSIAARIVAALAATPDDHVLEIGPGRGALTARYAHLVARLVLVELDRGLAARLERDLAEHRHARVVHADVLRLRFADLREGPRLRLLANLPYAISSPVVLKVLEEMDDVGDAVLTFQREFAQRLAAKADTPDYGSLSALAQSRLQVTHLFDVPPSAFHPRPAVQSSVVRLEPLTVPLVAPADYLALKLVLRVCFSSRRKTLANALGRGLHLTRDATHAVLAEVGLDPSCRPQTVSPRDWSRLAARIPIALRPPPPPPDI